MGHITCDAQRVENEAIHQCQYANVPVYKEMYRGWDDEPVFEWTTENRCGDTRYLSHAQDQCKRCGKVFTY